MRRKTAVMAVAILVLCVLFGAASALTSKFTAFKDFDVNDDGMFTVKDVTEVINKYISCPDCQAAELYEVSKYDVNLDAYITSEDISLTEDAYNAMVGRKNITVNFRSTKIQTDIGDFLIAYVPPEELDNFTDWFNYYTQVNYHTWSAAGHPNESLPRPTPYAYVCLDFAVDAYWVATRNFLGPNGFDYNILIGFPYALARSPQNHAYNAILTGKDWTNPNNWLIFEPQKGVYYTWQEIKQNKSLQKYYSPDYLDVFFEFYKNGKPYYIEIYMTDYTYIVATDTGHPSVWFAELARDDSRVGVELDHKAGPFNIPTDNDRIEALAHLIQAKDKVPSEVAERFAKMIVEYYEGLSPPLT